MNTQLPPQQEIVFVERKVDSIDSYSTSSRSETDSDSENTKTRKTFTLNETLEALKTLKNLSEEQLPQLEKNAEEYAKIREKSITEQQKTNELLAQLSKHLENFDNTKTDIAKLKQTSSNHTANIVNHKQDIDTLKEFKNTVIENITGLLQTNTHTKEDIKQLFALSKNNSQAFADQNNRINDVEQKMSSLYRKVQLYMTGSVAILAVSLWIWWKSYRV